MNVQHNKIRDCRLHEFKLGHNSVKSTKNICCVKGEGAVDYSTETILFKKKNLDDKAKSSQPKIMYSKTVCLVWFYGISTIIGYSIPNPLYTYILNI